MPKGQVCGHRWGLEDRNGVMGTKMGAEGTGIWPGKVWGKRCAHGGRWAVSMWGGARVKGDG